eukprot:TRINITY_DN7521_c0_g1_i1.p1 TRINITY_DN7521_c0_g1~~TRINITY_DN7521_c0_g1_i1.p1  ORF type:complete len:237 (-),score=82.28 TRINITY_DN7521_c0_g1_i1:366-1076(-)
MSAEQQQPSREAAAARRQEASRRILAGHLTDHQINKLNTDIRKTEDSVHVLSELLAEAIPGQENGEDKEMLEELARNCKEMQKRVVQLLQVIEHRELMQSLLDCNDSFNNVFIRYERYKRNQPPANDDQQTSHNLKTPVSPSRPTSSDAALLAAGDKDFQEMEEWMKTENADELEAMRREFESADSINFAAKKSADSGTVAATKQVESGTTSPEDGGTSEEFNKFLERRIDAAKGT